MKTIILMLMLRIPAGWGKYARNPWWYKGREPTTETHWVWYFVS